MQSVDKRRQLLEEVLELSTATYWAGARPELETIECYLTQPGWLIIRDSMHPYHPMLLACLQRLREHFPDPELLGKLAADLYFSSGQSGLEENDPQEDKKDAVPTPQMPLQSVLATQQQTWLTLSLQRLFSFPETVSASTLEETLSRPQRKDSIHGLRLLRILNACIWQCPPRDLEERVKAFLKSKDEYDVQHHFVRGLPVARWVDCHHLLPGLPSSPQLLSLLTYLRPLHLHLPASQGFHTYDDHEPLLVLIRALFNRGLFSYEIFRHVAYLHVSRFMKASWWQESDDALHQQVKIYQERLVNEIAQNLNEENYSLLLAFARPLSGSQWLLAAARAHDDLQPGELVGSAGEYSPETLAQSIIRLARAQDVEPDEELARTELMMSLRGFPQSTLKALFGVASNARRILCQALGWQEIISLVDLVEQLSEPIHGEDGTLASDVGELDISPVREVLAQVNKDLAEEALAILVRGKAGVENAATLVRAVGGWNRAGVLRGLKHNSHIAIKAYGLLPLTRGENEVMERYLELQRQARIGQHFGTNRRANHAAAIEVALVHLAQVGGYRDVAHLEWEMEARIVRQTTETASIWTAGAYTFQVVLEGAQATLQITRNGRVLKSIPQEVRASAAYKKEARDALALMRTHVSRVKKGLLERLLATGEPLSDTELSRLLEIPTVRTLLSMLIWQAADGTQGLLEPDTLTLCDLAGTRHPLPGPVIVAHPYHLFQADTLSAWQHFLMHHRIVQPIKQAFRELYVLTPAEQQTGTFSQRFSNHTINGNIALRLFASRNWRVTGRHAGQPLAYKTFSGIQAFLELSHNGHYLGEPGSAAVTGTIYFVRPRTANSTPGTVPLAEVPPLIFSEVMRDVDLVVSVAQLPAHENQVYQSPEIYTRTGEVVRALLDELQLPGVTIAGHFAFVQGKLARYRVHLGSAAIHIEPGSYLCVVPSSWGQTHEQLFLPFANEDTRLGEVISKILLLLADDQIKDETILRQIRRARTMPGFS